MKNANLHGAKRAKNDEFYTRYEDIEKEMNAYLDYDADVFRGKTILLPCDDPEWSNFTRYFAQNFERFGVKKLISTSYAPDSKAAMYGEHLTPEKSDEGRSDGEHTSKGKIFVIDEDTNRDGKIDIKDLKWDYLEGDGDFRSEELARLRDEADIVITNPPFSLFREYMAWIMEGKKKFVVIGSKNCVTYKEIFPLIKENKMWVGSMSFTKDMLFTAPFEIDPNQHPRSATRIVDGEVYLRSPSVWFTNIEHGRRHQPLTLMTMADNLKFNKRLKKRLDGAENYQ